MIVNDEVGGRIAEVVHDEPVPDRGDRPNDLARWRNDIDRAVRRTQIQRYYFTRRRIEMSNAEPGSTFIF